MKLFRLRHLVLLTLCGILSPVQAMDTQEILLKADQLSSTGDHPEEAIQLYQSIVDDAQNHVHVILSKLKIASILDEQLMQYAEAIAAYRAFQNDYPDNRLARITSKRAEELEQLQSEGLLNNYREFKLLERDYLRSSDGHKKAAIKLYTYALTNHEKPFSNEVINRTMAALTQSGLYFKANSLAKFAGKASASDNYLIDEIQEGIKKFWMVLASRSIIAICLLFIVIGKGLKPAWAMLKTKKKNLLIITAVLFLYMIVYYLIARKYDPDIELKHLLLILGQSLILIPFSIALYNSFSFLKNRTARNLATGLFSILLGLSCWVLFMNHIKFLLVTTI